VEGINGKKEVDGQCMPSGKSDQTDKGGTTMKRTASSLMRNALTDGNNMLKLQII
jgi:hypothetical protein